MHLLSDRHIYLSRVDESLFIIGKFKVRAPVCMEFPTSYVCFANLKNESLEHENYILRESFDEIW